MEARIDNVEARLTARIDDVEGRLSARIDDVEGQLSAKIEDAVDRLGTQMRVLPENAIAKISLIKEGTPSTPNRKRQSKRS